MYKLMITDNEYSDCYDDTNGGQEFETFEEAKQALDENVKALDEEYGVSRKSVEEKVDEEKYYTVHVFLKNGMRLTHTIVREAYVVINSTIIKGKSKTLLDNPTDIYMNKKEALKKYNDIKIANDNETQYYKEKDIDDFGGYKSSECSNIKQVVDLKIELLKLQT